MNIDDIHTIAVVGAGLIGQAAATEFALGRYQVNLHSRSDESLQRGIKKVEEILRQLTSLGLVTQDQADTALPRIQMSRDLNSCVEDVQVVYEAVYEDRELKQQIFGDLDRFCPASTILVRGTSTLSVKDLASVTNRPDKVLLANYSNPPYLVPLAEVTRDEATSDETVTTFCDLLTKIGKKPVVIQKDTPGFVANRLQGALLREALSLVDKGIVTAQDIDTIITSSFGPRWATAGVFDVFELAGWDLVATSASYLLPQLDNSPDVPPGLERQSGAERTGCKNGQRLLQLDARIS